ncbi:esterase [Pelomonas sp. HMWF004]|nr:esterase [Pelomonas sp. HMWF004]
MFRRLSSLALVLALSACAFGPTQPSVPVTVPPTPTPTLDPIPAVKPPPKPPRLGLALGGGAARGFAHIGVIQVLEENGIKVDLVAGTSAGSLVAALYASGKGGKEMQTLAEGMDEGAITDWSFPLRGLIRGEALARFIRDKTGGKGIEQMALPLGIVATDLSDGAPILFRSGDTGTAVRASSAVPAVFQPVKIGQREYVDGGLVSPVPVRFAREMGAQLVVAVDITSPPEKNPPGDAFRMLMQTFSIMGRSINTFELKDADIVMRPQLDGVGSADFTARRRAIQAGREAAQVMLPLLRQRIADKTR